MSWRIVIIKERSKLDLKLGYLVIRKNSDDVKKVFLKEIYMLVIETTAASITSSLLCEMVKKKIKVIFCDEKHNPSSTLLPCYGSFDTSLKIRNQIKWSDEIKQKTWTKIVTKKIKNQADVLKKMQLDEYLLLEKYVDEIEFNDASNREGHAAKVYFNALFGKEFTRGNDCIINAALNYGYSIILSAFTREIVCNGYLTQIGIFHDNMFNDFNLASDLMEPFRPIVDEYVFASDYENFEHEEKTDIINLLCTEFEICGKKHYLSNAIKIYTKSVFECLNEDDTNKIRFIRNEL